MIQLNDTDTIVAAALDVLDTTQPTTTATRRFLVLAHRPAWDFMLCEDLGDEIVKICDLPGEKDTSATMLAGENCITVYLATRPIDVSGAPCVLIRHDEPIAGILPMERTALRRVRNVARIVSKYLPAAAGELYPYTL